MYSINKRSGRSVVTLRELSQDRLHLALSSAILLLLSPRNKMFDELNDMPGEIFDVPNIETILVEDENGDIGVDLTEDA